MPTDWLCRYKGRRRAGVWENARSAHGAPPLGRIFPINDSYVEEGLMSIRNETDRINALEQLLRRLGKMIENTHEHVDYGLAIKSLG